MSILATFRRHCTSNLGCTQVKADRGEYKDSKDSIAELQKQTAEAAERDFKKNKGK